MLRREQDWHPVFKILYWVCISIWILFVLSFYSDPGGLLGGFSAAVLAWLSPKYVTLFINTFSLVGVYAITRLLISFRIKWKTAGEEATVMIILIFLAATGFALAGARCDIYVFCSEDIFHQSESKCEVEWDRSGPHCS